MKRHTIIKIYKKFFIDALNNYNDINNVEKRGRKNKLDNEHYIDKILRVLVYNEPWNYPLNKLHESTYRKKFYEFRNKGIFNSIYKNFYDEYIKNRTFKDLFIDSSIIQNNNMSCNMIDYCYKYKSKKTIKLNIICDRNKVIHSYNISNPKKHDSTFIDPLIKQIKVNLRKKNFLIGDKGYIKKKRNYKHNYSNIKLITPKRKNNKKTRHNKNDKRLLNHRYIVEFCFGDYKNLYKRIDKLTDRNIDNYLTFFNIASTCQIIKAMKNNFETQTNKNIFLSS